MAEAPDEHALERGVTSMKVAERGGIQSAAVTLTAISGGGVMRGGNDDGIVYRSVYENAESLYQ